MKKLLALALVLATSAALIACTAAEQTASATTPAVTDPGSADPDAPIVIPGAEIPVIGTKISDLLAKGNHLQSAIDKSSLALTNMTPYGGSEGVDKLFNGITKGDKLAGNVNGTAEITWKTTSPTTVSAYVLITGNDSGEFGRLPYSWEFFGSNDNGSTWTSIDCVKISGITKTSNSPFGYTVDTPAPYTSYKLAVSAVSEDGITAGGSALQLSELILVGTGASSPTEKPIVGSAINTMIASGNLAARIVDPYATYVSVWGDGAVINAFDGNTHGTKFGGGGLGGPVNFNWITDLPTTVNGYVLYTASDSAIRGRTPHSWVLYGSNDGDNWTVIDYVADAGFSNSNSTPYGYSVDSPATYTYYTFSVLSVLNTNGIPEAPGAISFNELILIGEAAKN